MTAQRGKEDKKMYPGYEEDMAELKRLCEKALATVNKLEANIDELIAEVEARSKA